MCRGSYLQLAAMGTNAITDWKRQRALPELETKLKATAEKFGWVSLAEGVGSSSKRECDNNLVEDVEGSWVSAKTLKRNVLEKEEDESLLNE